MNSKVVQPIEPLHESIKIELYIPRHVDKVWRALGWNEKDYQRWFLDVLRSQFDWVSEVPVGRGARALLEQEIKHIVEDC